LFKKAENNLRAFFIPNGLKTLTLADSYARMIRYTDCMIDTSSLIIKENAQRSWTEMNNDYDEMSLKEKKQLLEEMRSTRVIGECSQDDSPRIHAQNIAIVAAETTT
jgi:hypothetical protein